MAVGIVLAVGTGCSNHSTKVSETTRVRRPRPTTTVPATAPPKSLVIGLITGSVEPVARRGMIRSAELAVGHINEDQWLPGWRVELALIDDTKADSAVKAARKLAARSDVIALVGPDDPAIQAKLGQRSLPVVTIQIDDTSPGPASLQAFAEDYAAAEVAEPPGPYGPATYEAILQVAVDAGPALSGTKPDRDAIAAAVGQRLAALATPSTTSTSSTSPVTNGPNSA